MKKLTKLENIKIEWIRLWILAALTFVIVPLISALFASSDTESPIYTSISRLGWLKGHKAFMYIWGAIIFVPMGYTMWYAMKYADFHPVLRQLFKWFTIAFLVIIFAGALIPAHDPGPDLSNPLPRGPMALAHDHMSKIGMFGVLGVEMAYCIVAFIYKKWEHATLMSLLVAFLIGSGVYCFVEVKDATTYCGVSAATQIYAFCVMFIVIFVIYYYYARKQINVWKAAKAEVEETASEENKEIEE